MNATQPRELKFWKGEDVSAWLMQDQRALYAGDYGIMLKNDPDYTGALLQANPFHRDFLRQAFPTGEMFQPLAHFLLKVGRGARSPLPLRCCPQRAVLCSDTPGASGYIYCKKGSSLAHKQ